VSAAAFLLFGLAFTLAFTLAFGWVLARWWTRRSHAAMVPLISSWQPGTCPLWGRSLMVL